MKVAQLCSNSPHQNAGVGSLSLLHGIFPTQGLNPGLPHCRQILCQLSHKGNPRILKWLAFPFSIGSSWPRNQTGVSCIEGRFFTNWVTEIKPAIHSWNKVLSAQIMLFFWYIILFCMLAFYLWGLHPNCREIGLQFIGLGFVFLFLLL